MEDDPEKPLEDSLEAVAARHRKTYMILGGVVAVILLLLGAYHLMTRPAPLPGTGENLSAAQLDEAVKPWVGRLEFIGASGKPQPVGLAVTIGNGEMVTTCHNMPRGGELHVVFFDGPSKAEAARLNKQLDVCQLRVKTTGPTAAKLRGSDPAQGEKVYVVMITDPAAPAKLIESRVTSPIADAGGAGFGIESKEAFSTGAAVFDRQGRLAGIINAPHTYGDFTMAYGVARIASARERQPPAN
jgi:hypothetical protein